MKTGRRCGGALAALMLLLFAGDGFGASVVEKDVDKDGKSEFVLDNKALRLVIAPHFGAQAISVFRNDIGVEYVPIEPGGGFFSDHDSRQTWPGEFFSAKYDVSIQKDSGETDRKFDFLYQNRF